MIQFGLIAKRAINGYRKGAEVMWFAYRNAMPNKKNPKRSETIDFTDWDLFTTETFYEGSVACRRVIKWTVAEIIEEPMK